VTTVALVHGAWHGAWCWERLQPELEASGHRVVAVDLPIEDARLGSADYAAVVTRALEAVEDDVVVVGHSLVFADGFGEALVRDELDRSYWPDGAAARGLYPECEPELASWAAARLQRQSRRPSIETTPLETWPDVESAYVLGTRDHVVDPVWSRRAARDRLHTKPVELDAGHSPFLTCPRELADLLG
jgi:pimeloyl-ACP methyl ester carboxylesterase